MIKKDDIQNELIVISEVESAHFFTKDQIEPIKLQRAKGVMKLKIQVIIEQKSDDSEQPQGSK